MRPETPHTPHTPHSPGGSNVLEVPAGEQRDLDLGAARVRVANHSAREAAHIPGSPHRGSTAPPVTVTAQAFGEGSPSAFPENVEVHLELEHSDAPDDSNEGDAEVALKMQQFTQHLNKAYVEDVGDLQRQLREKDLQLQHLAATKDARIRQLLLHNEALQRSHMVADREDFVVGGSWLDRLKRSYRRSKACWWCCILLLLLVVLFIILLGVLVPKNNNALATTDRSCSSNVVGGTVVVVNTTGSSGVTPSFLFPPTLSAAGNSSLDVLVAVQPTALVYYVLLPGSSASRHLLQLPSVDSVMATAGGVQGAGLTNAAACGVAPVTRAVVNTTITISSQTVPTTECATAIASSTPLCSRCPRLLPNTTYQLLMVAATSGGRSQLQSTLVTTGAAWASSAPQLRTGSSLQPPKANLLSSGSGTFAVQFTLTGPGSVRFLVAYSLAYARFGNIFATFGNQPMTDAPTLTGATRARFSNGLVATGLIAQAAADTTYTCAVEVMGLGGVGMGCACSPAIACTVDSSCFGDLCLYSRFAVLPQSTYTVTLVPTSADGVSAGTVVTLPPFQTPAANVAPWPSNSMSAASAVTPNSFVVNGIQQDRTGFMYLLVGRLNNPAAMRGQPAGTATAFKQGATRRMGRRLQQTSAKLLPPTSGSQAGGDMFDPPCVGSTPCDTNNTVKAWLNPVRETMVYATCIPVNTISAATSTLVNQLQDDTIYHVMAIPTDLAGNQAAWSAYVRTQDTTPPVLTIVDIPTPGLTTFSLVTQLNEPGIIYGTVMYTSSAAQVTAAPQCAPTWQGPTLIIFNQNVTQGSANVTLGPFTVPQESTNYTVRMIAQDVYGNCQKGFSSVTVATADRNPPVFLQLGTTNTTGSSSVLMFGLNKRGSINYQVMATSSSPCPTPDQLFALQAATGYEQVPSWVGTVNIGWTLGGTDMLTGLDSQTNYTLCAIAQGMPPLGKKQPSVSSTTFLTLDVTPPNMTLAMVNASDGDVSCSRTNYLCNGTFTVTLSEQSDVVWVVLANATALPSPLPTPQNMFASTNLSSLFPGALASSNGTGQVVQGTAPLLPSLPNAPTPYVLIVAAHDLPPNQAPNFAPKLSMLNFDAPDVTPPLFQNVSLAGRNGSSISVNATVNEASSVKYVVLVKPSKVPTAAEVAMGTGSAGAAVNASGSVSAFQMGVPQLFTINGLSPGTVYDIYMAVIDIAGNLQPRVANLTSIRTPDTRPPLILSLSATFTPPMNLTITVTSNKPGTLLFAARAATAPALTQQQVLDAVATQSTALANFTDLFDIPDANAAFSLTECAVDGQLLVIYGVVQDMEGQFPPYVPNNSSVSSAPVILVPTAATGSCLPEQFLAPLSPLLAFQSAGPGLAYGPIASNSSVAAGVVWSQAVGAFNRQPPTQAMSMVSRIGNLVLPVSGSLAVKPLPPSAIEALVRSYVLVPEANGQAGSTLRVSFQLSDTAGRTQVDMTGVRVRPLLNYTNVTPPSGVTNAANNALGDCDVSSLDPDSGIGECAVQVANKFFPINGDLTIDSVLQVMQGAKVLATSDPSPVVLAAPPKPPRYTASSPGVIMTLPYRAVYFGETITVTIVASNPTPTPLTRFSVPIRWNSNVLTYVSATASGMWSSLQVADPPIAQVPLGSFNGKILSVGSRAAGADTAQYQSSSSIPLLEVTFTVRQAMANVYAGVLSLGRSTTLWPNGPPLQLDPGFAGTPVLAYDFRGSGAAAGDLNVTGIGVVGVWTWADNYILYNTAALQGGSVSATLYATTVSNYGPEDTSIQSCSLPGGAAVSRALSVTPPAGGTCTAQVGRVNTQGAAGVAVNIALRGFSKQLQLSVWYPTNITVWVQDPTLNAVLPINANKQQVSPGCTDLYQVSRMGATADWTNGASGLLPASDITRLVQFASNDSSVALVLGSTVKGVSAGAALISLVGVPSASTLVTVSDEAVCLLSLTALATTGIRLAQNVAGAGSSGTLYLPPRPLVDASSTWYWQAAQDLNWEAASAVVLTYATFTDGSTMDVTPRSSLSISAAALAAAASTGNSSNAAPFTLGTNAQLSMPTVVVNATVGSRASCSPSLVTTWTTCSLTLGSGTGTVRVQLPGPRAIVNFTATPAGSSASNISAGNTPVITSSSDPAALAPMSLPTSAALGVFVSFSDGSVRDFSNDPRTSMAVTAGAAICNVTAATGGGWQVLSPSNGMSGTCTIRASVAFNGSAPLTATTSVAVVVMSRLQLWALDSDAIALPGDTADDLGPALGPTLTLLKCDERNYDQRTIWALGMLSSCTNSTCDLMDLNQRTWTNLTSSTTAVAQLMTGYPGNPNYATYPNMDNRLVPFAAGNTIVSAAFGGVAASVAVTVQDTYQDTWPAGSVVNDTALSISANMSAAYELLMQAVPSAQLDLAANPPAPADVIKNGLTLVSDTTQGPFYYSATAAGLISGTNYSVLLAVRKGTVVSPGITAVTGLLVADHTPPSFTQTLLTAASSDPALGTFTIKMTVGIDEPGGVYYAVYGNPACITAAPTVLEVQTARNLADVGKCNCTYTWCAAVASGRLPLTSSNSSAATFTGPVPTSPYVNLASQPSLQCQNRSDPANPFPPAPASTRHAMYMAAEDDLPTFKGWTSVCTAPQVDQTTAPTPCAPVTINRCNNTRNASIPDVPNLQTAAWYNVSQLFSNSNPPPPVLTPVSGVVNTPDPYSIAFTVAQVTATTSNTIVFKNKVNKPGLVVYRLVQNVIQELAWGYRPVLDASITNTEVISRDCSQAPLVPGVVYGLWYWAIDNYGVANSLALVNVTIPS